MDSERFATRDLGLASFLLCLGRPLVFHDGLPGQKVFYFEEVTDADVNAFVSGAPAPARALLDAHRALKSLLHAGSRREVAR